MVHSTSLRTWAYLCCIFKYYYITLDRSRAESCPSKVLTKRTFESPFLSSIGGLGGQIGIRGSPSPTDEDTTTPSPRGGEEVELWGAGVMSV